MKFSTLLTIAFVAAVPATKNITTSPDLIEVSQTIDTPVLLDDTVNGTVIKNNQTKPGPKTTPGPKTKPKQNMLTAIKEVKKAIGAFEGNATNVQKKQQLLQKMKKLEKLLQTLPPVGTKPTGTKPTGTKPVESTKPVEPETLETDAITVL
jgi:hypothetical protein